MSAGDEFGIEGPVTAGALQALSTALIAREAWADGDALIYSAADGKLHPVPVAPLAGAVVSVNASSPLASSGGVAPIISLTGVVDLAHGGTGSASGDASNLTNIPASALTGSIADARLSANVALLASSQTFTGQKTFPSAGATAVVLPAVRQTSGGFDISVPLASGADSFALVAQSQMLTNKSISGSSNTLTAIGNSSLTNSSLTVTASTGLTGGGAVSLGSSVSLSLPSVGTAGTYAYPSSMTTDTQGRVSSVAAGSAPTIGGSSVMLAQVSSNGGAGWIFTGDFFGLSQMTESGRGTATNVAPWVAPCAGTLKNFRTWTVAAAPSNSAFTVYQAATSSTPTYNATSAVLNIASGAHLGADTTHTLTIAAGDLIIFKTDTSWTNPGFCIQGQFIPSTS